MGGVVKAVGGVLKKAAPFASFIPGVGPLLAGGIGLAGSLLPGGGGQQYAGGGGTTWGGRGGTGQAGQQGFAPSGGPIANSPIANSIFGQQQAGTDQSELFRIAQLFGDQASTLQGRDSDLFSMFTNAFNQSQDPNFGTLSAEEVAKFGGDVGGAVGRQLFAGGGQVEQAFNQGIGQNVESGFGIGGGTSNALLNAFKQANEQSRDAGIAGSGQFANALASVVNTNTQASVQDRSLLGQLLQGSGGQINSLLENYFGATQTGQGLPGDRLFDQQNYSQQEQAFPYILDKLKGPSFIDRAGESIFGKILDDPVGVFNTGKDIFGSVFGGGGGGGSGGGVSNPISNSFGQFNPNSTYFGGSNYGGSSGSNFTGGETGFYDNFNGSNPIYNAAQSAGYTPFRPTPTGGWFGDI